MSEPKHTPGPWKFQDDAGAGIHIYGPAPFKANCVEFTLKAQDQRLFTLPDLRVGTARHSTPESYPSLAYETWLQFPPAEWDAMQLANAKLISAAPELLDACERALNLLQDLGCHHEHVDQLSAAIVKATQ